MSTTVPETASVRIGQQIDQYRIEAIIASSGMAVIFRATDLRCGRQVAIKLPHFEMESDPVLFDRFRREEEIGEQLDHPSVIKVFEEKDRSQLYMVMEWVEGRSLREILNRDGKFPAARALAITHNICDALAYIHSQGIVHRDLKPENIMIDDEDRVKLIDFGIAAKAGARRLTFGKFSKSLGTPTYTSPEQIRGKRGDARSDLYSLGVMLYEMLTGEEPFPGPSSLVILNSKLKNDPVPPRELDPAISPQLEEIIYRALERDPKNRYRSAQEFAWDLEHQNEIGAADRHQLRDCEECDTPWKRKAAVYSALAAIPIIIFALLVYVASHQ